MKASLIAIVLLVFLKASGLGEMRIEESIEWKTMDSPLILVGRVTAVKDIKKGVRGTVTIAVSEVLRGTWKEPNLEVYTRQIPRDDVSQKWLKSGHDHLFFLRPTNSSNESHDMQGGWTIRGHRDDDGVFDLVKPEMVCSTDMTMLTDRQQILDRVRLWSDRSSRVVDLGEPLLRQVMVGAIRVEGSSSLPNYSLNQATFMIVPAEEKHRARAMKLIASTQPQERGEGATILGNLPETPESLKVLEGLLNDPGEVMSKFSEHELSAAYYPAREPAWIALTILGHKPAAKPALLRPPTEEERQAASHEYFRYVGTHALGNDWKLASLESTPAPPRWIRLWGHNGFAAQYEKGSGPQAVSFTLYYMPKQKRSAGNDERWVAESATAALDITMKYSVRPPSPKTTPDGQDVVYLGCTDPMGDPAEHVFVSPDCPPEIRSKLVRYFDLKVRR